jgi:hypothetical protein
MFCHEPLEGSSIQVSGSGGGGNIATVLPQQFADILRLKTIDDFSLQVVIGLRPIQLFII